MARTAIFWVVSISIALACAGAFASLERQAEKRKAGNSFPVSEVLGKLGGNPDFSVEAITFKGHQGYLLTKDDERLVCNLVDGFLVLGDVVSSSGENITQEMAKHYKAGTFLSAMKPMPLTENSVSATKPIFLAENSKSSGISPKLSIKADGDGMIIRQELFDFMVKLPGFDIGGKEGPVRIVMFSWETCPSCRAIKKILTTQKLPFRIWDVPVGGTKRAVESALLRLGATDENRDELARRINDATIIMKTLTGKVAVPVYAFQKPDGQIYFGYIPAQEFLNGVNYLVSKEK